MFKDDRLRVQHMLDAANEARMFAHGCTRSELDQNRVLALALVKCIEIIGEAAARVSKPYRDQHPSVPWRSIIAMRNRLIHAYFDVDLDRVWDTITDDLPPLVAALEQLVAQEEGNH